MGTEREVRTGAARCGLAEGSALSANVPERSAGSVAVVGEARPGQGREPVMAGAGLAGSPCCRQLRRLRLTPWYLHWWPHRFRWLALSVS